MKLSQLLPKSQDLPITFPDGEPTGIVLKVVGQDSKQVREVTKRFALIMDEQKPTLERMNQVEQRASEIVAACIVGWTGLEDEDGNPLPYSPDKALELVSKPELAFISEQVVRYAADRQNFFRRGDNTA